MIVDAAWWVGAAMQDTETAVFAVTAGLGSGKTHGDCQWHHYLVLQNSQSRFSGFLEPTYQKISDAAIPTYEKVLKSFGYTKGADYKIIKSPYPKLIYMNHPAKHEVHFVSAENPEKLVAVEYSHGTADEAGILPWEAVRNFRSRIRETSATRRQLMLSGAPQGVNDFAAEFDSETLNGWDTSTNRDHFQREKRYRRFILWTDDNPYLPSDYIQLLEDTYGHNPNLLKSYRFGQFCPLTEGAVYSNYFPQKHDILDSRADAFRELNMLWDFNRVPLAWVVVQKTPFDFFDKRVHKYVAYDEANLGNQQLRDAVIEFAAKFPREVYSHTPINLYGDRTGHAKSHKIAGSDFETIKEILNELGYKNVTIRATVAVAPEAASVDAVQRLLARNLLLICKRCKMLRKSFLATTWKDGVRKIDKPAGETWTHHGDAVKYWAWQETRDETGSNTKRIYGVNT